MHISVKQQINLEQQNQLLKNCFFKKKSQRF